jgi:hypothetical protein
MDMDADTLVAEAEECPLSLWADSLAAEAEKYLEVVAFFREEGLDPSCKA